MPIASRLICGKMVGADTGCSPSRLLTKAAFSWKGHAVAEMQNTKICTGCKCALPLDAFHKWTRGTLGRCSKCKECVKRYNQTPAGREANAKKYKKYKTSQKGRTKIKEARRNRRIAEYN